MKIYGSRDEEEDAEDNQNQEEEDAETDTAEETFVVHNLTPHDLQVHHPDVRERLCAGS